jgi:hypothetical protein
MHSVQFSALSMHYPQFKTLQRASVVCYNMDITLSLMALGASVFCYITDITLSRMAGSHLVPRILHWLLT